MFHIKHDQEQDCIVRKLMQTSRQNAIPLVCFNQVISEGKCLFSILIALFCDKTFYDKRVILLQFYIFMGYCITKYRVGAELIMF